MPFWNIYFRKTCTCSNICYDHCKSGNILGGSFFDKDWSPMQYFSQPFDSCLTFSIALLSIAYSFNYTVFNRFMTHRNWHRYISNWVTNEDLKLSEKRFGITLPVVFVVFVKFNTNWSFLIEFAKAWEIFPLIVLSFLLKK